jgi:hydroxymethylbilane synthase
VRLRAGTRGSALALAQTDIAIAALRRVRADVDVEVIPMSTRGDVDKTTPFEQLGGKGIFAHELQRALAEGEIDIAVHSLKDLTGAEPDELRLVAILEREDARDCLVSRDGAVLADLPPGAVVGTSSVRRAALLRAERPDLETAPLRGNVDTRLRKVRDGEVDAAILAAAGILRLGRGDEISEYLDPLVFVPPPGQGAIAIEARGDRSDLDWLSGAEHAATRTCVDTERSFMRVVEGSCEVPLGAWARIEDGMVVCDAFLVRSGEMARATGRGAEPEVLGRTLAQDLIARF